MWAPRHHPPVEDGLATSLDLWKRGQGSWTAKRKNNLASALLEWRAREGSTTTVTRTPQQGPTHFQPGSCEHLIYNSYPQRKRKRKRQPERRHPHMGMSTREPYHEVSDTSYQPPDAPNYSMMRYQCEFRKWWHFVLVGCSIVDILLPPLRSEYCFP